MIKEIPINDGWLYRRGFLADCLEPDFDWSDSFIVQLPHNVKCGSENYFDERAMRAVGTYSRILTVPETYNGKRLLLRMEGVLSYAEVYVNGIFVTSHKGEAPFVADITAPVKYNYENRIVIKADAALRPEYGSGTRGPLTLFGGVHRDAVFMICDGRDIRDVCVRTVREGNKSLITADAELYDYYPDTELSGEILDPSGNSVGELAPRTVVGSAMRLHGEVSSPEYWQPDNPVMYTASVKLKSGKKIIDCKTVRFGFASAVFRRDGFYLNGKQIKLIGLNRADCYPAIGRAATAETERRDARIIKEMGCNAVRTMGQASRDFIDECNRIGLMVIEDVYGDGYIGNADWREAFTESITDMILRDRNAPCIIGWGIRVNNSADCDELYFKANKAAKAADPTRATIGARNFVASKMFEDVFAYNECERVSRARRIKRKWFAPYIISEHTGSVCPSSAYSGESVRLEQALRHLEAIDDTLGGAALGAFGMSFCDFAAGRMHGDGDNVNHYGVFDAHRNPKLAAFAYMSQTDGEPVLELSSNLSECDFTGKLYVFTNADKIVMYRDGEKTGEILPDRKRFPHLKHPPVVIDDFCGDLPAREVGEGLRLKLFKSVIRSCEKFGPTRLGAVASKKAYFLGKLCKLDNAEITALAEKYLRIPPQGVTYKFEAVYGGEVKKTRVIMPAIRKTLSVESSCEGTLKCTKSFERIAFSLTAEDGRGNVLDYCFMPVTVCASGSLSVEGSGHLSLQGGKGGFFVRSISAGPGRVAVTSDLGTKTMDFECVYESAEKV